MFIFITKGFYNFDSGMHEPTDFFKNAFLDGSSTTVFIENDTKFA